MTSQGQLYPNPNASVALAGINEDSLFEFLGRVLGKALAEGVVVQPQFARFFLAKLLHKPTHLHDHLPYLDMVRFVCRFCVDSQSFGGLMHFKVWLLSTLPHGAGE